MNLEEIAVGQAISAQNSASIRFFCFWRLQSSNPFLVDFPPREEVVLSWHRLPRSEGGLKMESFPK